ncbi:Alpha/Beta hydrolase protein [Endogone sp. FLAS-F59071]|nr:Alpha/Beta hydrolase protein [Endogone sp. FLAS-F59071]|eukprot:RUS22034.1 Alpha/Beta hydrolase protein [Endogone sp. FLAS-F59071]
MIDHILGKPSANWKRTHVILTILLSLVLLTRVKPSSLPSVIRIFNTRFSKFAPWQIVLGTWTVLFVMNNFSLFLGLNAPEPLARLYKRSFYRATWILTALDAGFFTAMSIRPKWARDFLSVLFSGYYLFYADAADEKTRRVRATITVEQMRVSWEKGVNPYLNFFSSLHRPRFTIRQVFSIPRPPNPQDGSPMLPVRAYKYYAGGPSETWAAHDSLLLHFPGGGFVTMPPPCHEDAIASWALETKVPIVSIDYGKAPEYPYPWAIEECFDVYKSIVETNGKCVGLSVPEGKRLKIVLIGDSAGGNLVAAVTLKLIAYNQCLSSPPGSTTLSSTTPTTPPVLLPKPTGLIIIYPCLEFDLSCWMSPTQLTLMRAESSASLEQLGGLMEAKDHLGHRSPLSVVPDVEKRPLWRRTWSVLTGQKVEEKRIVYVGPGAMRKSGMNGTGNRNLTAPGQEQAQGQRKRTMPRLAMTSRMSFFNDRIITPDLMRAMAILYLGPDSYPDFATDYLLSPIVAPAELLAQFPRTYFMTGEKDPFVDDTVIFAGRIRQAKRDEAARRMEPCRPDGDVTVKILQGMSHAFLQMMVFLPEAKDAVRAIGAWVGECFKKEEAEEAEVWQAAAGAERAMADKPDAEASALVVDPAVTARLQHEEGLFMTRSASQQSDRSSSPAPGAGPRVIGVTGDEDPHHHVAKFVTNERDMIKRRREGVDVLFASMTGGKSEEVVEWDEVVGGM